MSDDVQPARYPMSCSECGMPSTENRYYPMEYGAPIDRYYCARCEHEWWYSDPCSKGLHRPPQGPNEDVAICTECWNITFSLRPEGETFGEHEPDCSLPLRHLSFCVGGGAGHPPSRIVRG